MSTRNLLAVMILGFSLVIPGLANGVTKVAQTKFEAVRVKKAPFEKLPPGSHSSWWASVQQEIRTSEFNVTWQGKTKHPDISAAYQAPNRAHNIRTYFTSEGIRVVPRVAKKPSWTWGLRLKSLGSQGNVQPVEVATLSTTGNRVEYVRGSLTEWYVNDDRGLEQGFTLRLPPKFDNIPAESWLALKMDLLGELKGKMNANGNAIDFVTDGGAPVMRFSKLHAFDSTGRALQTRFTLKGAELDILVNTRNAEYPITIDPLATTYDWASHGAQTQPGAEFGASVGTAGDVNADGYSDIIIGALGYDTGEADAGKVFVYHGSAWGLSSLHDWSAEGYQFGINFGYTVGTAGDINGDGFSDVIVGASGFISVYHGSAMGLSSVADWTAGQGYITSEFGHATGSAGDVNGDGFGDVIVGECSYSGNTAGRAFVYHGSVSGLSSSPDWSAQGYQAKMLFGRAVGTAGDVNGDGYGDVIIGAPGLYNQEIGSAFVYYGSALGLSASADWSAADDRVNSYFGNVVTTAGDVNGDGFSDIIVGAFWYRQKGRVYVFQGSSSGPGTTADWMVQGEQDQSYFGLSAGSVGDVNGDGFSDVIIGAEDYRVGDNSCVGQAFVYHGSPSGLNVSPDWSAGGTSTNWGRFGSSVGTAGDVNGDGFSDAIIGARGFNNFSGMAFVYHGSGYTPAPEAAFTSDTTSGIAPLSVQFVDKSTGSIDTWDWDLNNDGTTDYTIQNPTYNYSTAGIYTVSLTVRGPGGRDTTTKTNYIHVSDPTPTVIIKEAYTCNGSGQPQTVFPPKEPIQYRIVYDVQGDPGTQYKATAIISAFGQTYQTGVWQYPGTDYLLVKDKVVPGTAAGKTKTINYKVKLKLPGQLLDIEKTTSQITVTGP